MSEQIEAVEPSDQSLPRSYDVVTLGETMLRLTPPGYRRLEQATGFEVEIGGSESNTAAGLTRLGLRTAWLSRLPANGLGRLIVRSLAGLGVDTAWVAWTDEDRAGLYFLEEGPPPRGSRITYDRAGSAFSRMQPDDLPTGLFQPGAARLLHLTGITPALGPAAAETARQALRLAQDAGWQISFDLNYRASLWSADQARAGCGVFAEAADLLIIPLNDARQLYGFTATDTAQTVLDGLTALYPVATIVLTLGKEGALGRQFGGAAVQQPAFASQEVGRIGGGDAFAAGLIYAYLQYENNPDRLALALRWGAAAAALKYATPGDLPYFTRAEVESLLMAETEEGGVRR